MEILQSFAPQFPEIPRPRRPAAFAALLWRSLVRARVEPWTLWTLAVSSRRLSHPGPLANCLLPLCTIEHGAFGPAL